MSSLTLKDSYKVYKEKNPKGSKHYVETKVYRSICYEFNKRISNFVLLEAGEFRIPYRLGVLRIRKRKTNMENLRMDFAATKKHGVKLYHLNEHSREYYYRYYWRKSQSIVKNKTAYSFKATRDNTRKLASLIKDTTNNIDYPE